jgi:hypothetical protein
LASRYISFSGNLSFSGTVAVEDGGGGSPEWVPENSAGHIDLLNDQAWTETGGIVALSTELGSDPNTDSAGWNASSFDPGNLTAEGYVFPDASDNGIALTGELRGKILAGSTIVVEWVSASALSFEEYPLILADAAGNWALFTFRTNASAGIHLVSWDNIDEPVTGTVTGTSAVNRMALTLTPTRAEASINGSEPTVVALAGNDWPASGYDCVLLDPGVSAILKSLTVYDPLPDATGLAALSALA